jgi:hypothetical protein
MASFAMLPNQVGAAKKAQVLGYGGPRYRESTGNLSGGLAAAAQQVEDGPARGVGQGLEREFGVSRCGICNRTVTHNV